MKRLREKRKKLLENRERLGPLRLKAELDRLREQGRDPMDRYLRIRRDYRD